MAVREILEVFRPPADEIVRHPALRVHRCDELVAVPVGLGARLCDGAGGCGLVACDSVRAPLLRLLLL